MSLRLGVVLWLVLFIRPGATSNVVAATKDQPGNQIMNNVAHLGDFPVIEFRRYTIKAGEREHFATYFETYFPEAFQQLGALALGQFLERGDASHFTWLRGFHSTYERPVINGAFYFGALWREHKATMNACLEDSDDVLLLRPLAPNTEVPVLPAVDPVREEGGAAGIVVAQIFALKSPVTEEMRGKVEPIFAHYKAAGVRHAGILTTLEGANNFPQLPVRNDGAYLVWLGTLKDEETLDAHFNALAQKGADSLATLGLLRDVPELVIMKPTRRSRLRWLPSWK